MSNSNNGQIVLGLDIPKTVNQINADIKKLEKQLEQVKATGVLDTDKTVKQLNAQIKSLQTQLKTIEIKANVDTKNVQKTGEQIGNNIAQGVSKGVDKATKQLNKIQLSIADKSYEADIAKITKGFTALSGDANEAKKHVKDLQNAYQQMVDATDDNSRLLAEQKYQQVLAKTKNELTIAQVEAKEYVDIFKIRKLRNDIQDWLKKNTAATEEAKAEMQSYLKMLESGKMSPIDFNTIKSGFDDWDTAMRQANKLGASFTDTLKQGVQKFTEWGLASGAVMTVVSNLREATTELKEIDTYLTEISKANDKLSDSQLKEIGNNSFDVASKYGKKSTDYLSGVQEASRAGYGNAEEIAELSVAAQGAGDMTAELSNQFIIATDKAYKLNGSVTELTKVLDGVNYITNHNAVNMSELSEGLSIVGSTAASFGVEANELSAALGTMAASTQQSGSEVARAFRAILLNIRQVSDADEGIDAEGLTKYEKACNALGVSLKETKDGVISLRDPMEVLKELSIEYNKLSEDDIKRTNLLNAVGSKLRSTQLDALLRQWSMYEEMLQQYTDGTGSMAREAEKTANSWEGSLNRLSNTWTDTIENVTNSDAIITGIDTLNGLLSVVNDVTDALGELGTIGLGAGLFAGIKNVGTVQLY